jgi:hypothetical protein
MNSNDAVSEVNPPVYDAQQPAGTENPNNPEPSMSAHNHDRHGVIESVSLEKKSGGVAEQLESFTDGKAVIGQEVKEPESSKQEPTSVRSEQAKHAESDQPLSAHAQRDKGTDDETQDEPSVSAVTNEVLAPNIERRSDKASSVNKDHQLDEAQTVKPNDNTNEGAHDVIVPHLVGTENLKFLVKTPESLKGNPYMLAASLTALGRGHLEVNIENDGLKESSADQDLGTPGIDMCPNDEPQRISCGEDPSNAPTNRRSSLDHQESADLRSEHGAEEQILTDDESVDDSDTVDDQEDGGEGENEHIASLEAKVQRGVARVKSSWKQRHEIFRDSGLEFQSPVLGNENDNDQFWAFEKIKRDAQFAVQDTPHSNQQQQPSASNAPQWNSRPHPSSARPSNNLAKHKYNDFSLGSVGMSIDAPIQSQKFQGNVQPLQQHASYEHHVMGYQNIGDPTQPYVQYPYLPEYPPLPVSQYEKPAQPLGPPPSNIWPPCPHPLPSQSNIQRHEATHGQLNADNAAEGTDDDEPLRTRVTRRPSMVSESISGNSSPDFEPLQRGRKQAVGGDPEVEFVGPKSKQKSSKIPPLKKAPPKRPTAPQSAPPHNTAQIESSLVDSIDWKLPEYEAVYTPAPTKNDHAMAKVSIPGLVREELVLSPDHAEQEVHLLLNIFIPSQKALANPDPSPALAILNFHTIAVMVIEAYVQYEIGDEFGTGRGHWHDTHDMGDGEYERLRDAKDADPDEIFFAVIDRWRAAMESSKEPAKMIRGAQEFCDTALDIVYYIKEHGLLAQKTRAERSDKGVKRGARRVDEAEDDGEKKGAKRKVGKINEVQVRKKTKVEKDKEKPKKEPVKKKSKAKEPSAITVIKAPRKK